MRIKYFQIILLILILSLISNNISAHCDSVEGPVVKASQKALESGNINYILIWIKPEGEQVVRDLFEKVLHVRILNEEAKELADNYFFETVVRVHRMGEGEPYTGLKPAGYKPGIGIETADSAIDNNSIASVLSIVDEKYHSAVKDLFNDVQSKKNYDPDDVQAGREYVTSYVHFIHYVEEISGGEPENHHMQ